MTKPTMTRTRLAAAVIAALALLISACGNDSGGGGSSTSGGGGKLSGASVTVGSKEFTESKILAQITIAVLKNAGAKVKDASLSGSATVRQALTSGDIDMYWEYTGTGWVNILGHTTTNVPKDLFAKVAAEDKAHKVAWLPAAPMNDTYRIAVTKDFSDQKSLTTMSQAASYIKSNPDDGKVCAASEFINRDDGLPGLEKAYGFKFSDVVELDLGLVYTQIGDKCSFGEVFSTDGRIVANKLVTLDDDKKFFVDYNAALTVRQETLSKYPAIKSLMAPVSKALTDEEITKLNAKVDVDGETESDVAKQWLDDKKLLS
jgi:osmoprotectant transport system substrate-binding protein